MKYLCRFERVGRNHSVPPLGVEGDSADEIAFHIYTYAKKYLMSRGVEVSVDLEKLQGTIYCGMHVGGNFSLEILDGTD